MDCDLAREALSSLLDNERLPPRVAEGDLEDHLSLCEGCRAWAAHAEGLRSKFRVQQAAHAPDMRGELLRLFDVTARTRASAGRVTVALRCALLVVAGLQLALVVPTLLLGHDREAPVHVAHEMGSFELAVALGLLAVVCRPAWAAGMAWFTVAAATTLVATAVGDLAGGATTIADESPHLLVVLAAVLLIALADRQRPPSGATDRRFRFPIWRGGPLHLPHESGTAARVSGWDSGPTRSVTEQSRRRGAA